MFLEVVKMAQAQKPTTNIHIKQNLQCDSFISEYSLSIESMHNIFKIQ